MTIFKDKLLTRAYSGKAGDYDVPYVFSRRELHAVFIPDLSKINWTIIIVEVKTFFNSGWGSISLKTSMIDKHMFQMKLMRHKLVKIS